MPLDPQVERVLQRVREANLREYWQMTPQEAREWHNRKAHILDIPPQPVHDVIDRTIAGPGGDLALRIYTPKASATPLPILVWLHGGGHVIGSLQSYDALCRMLALRAGCIVVAVDYRLAPEHKFPAGVDDSIAGLAWAGEHASEYRGDPARVAIGGDSAGANLAAVCAILARDRGGPALRFQLLVYPRTAPEEELPSHYQYAEGCMLTRRTILWFHAQYRASDADRNDFRYAPLICRDLTRLPPALVIVGEYDPIRDDGIAYAQALQRAGNAVTLTQYDGMVHPFFSMGGAIDRARDAHEEAAGALRSAFA